MVTAIVDVIISIVVVTVGRYFFGKGKMTNFSYITNVLAVIGGSWIITETGNFFRYIGIVIASIAIILKIIDIAREK